METLTNEGSGSGSGSHINNNNNNSNLYPTTTTTTTTTTSSSMGSSRGSNTSSPNPNNNGKSSIDINKSTSTTNNNNNNNNSNSNNNDENSFKTKTIIFNNKKRSILTQKENGPCPLIAIFNVLSLRGDLEINETLPLITYDGLVERIGSHLFETMKNYEDTEEQFNYEIKINDSINALPSMISGLNLDIKFTGIKDFDSSCDMSIFQVLNIDLVHGWLVETQDVELTSIIGDLTYNKLTERVCNSKLEEDFLNDVDLTKFDFNSNSNSNNSNNNNHDINGKSPQFNSSNNNKNLRNLYTDSVKYRNNPIKSSSEDLFSQYKIKQFLNDTSSQLSYHGLYELHSKLKENELVIFFRNNHFNTLYKKDQSLYLLVTDEGYINEPIVWERLEQIDGDTEYVKSDFKKYVKEDLYSSFDNSNNGNNGNINSGVNFPSNNNGNVNANANGIGGPQVNTEAMTDEELAHYLSGQENNQHSLDSDFAVALQLQNQENSKAGFRRQPKKEKKENSPSQKSKMCKTQ